MAKIKTVEQKPANTVEFVPDAVCPLIQTKCLEFRCEFWGRIGAVRTAASLEPVTGCMIKAACRRAVEG